MSFLRKKESIFPFFFAPLIYSLLSNEDVFKLIKYDILAQLIQDNDFKIEQEFDFSKAEYLKHFLSENRFLILRNLLKAIPKIRNVISAADELEELFSKYQEGLEQINSNAELEMLKEFQQESENNFLLEYDEASGYIASKLTEIAGRKSNGETTIKKVLVIDDLDRLDPEHIFRLFNVFSAHFDQVQYYENEDGNDNKFGFDKIIFVCDIENIRKIFIHKYGGEVDFSGYIDKFYSTRIYNFFQDIRFNEDLYPFFFELFQNSFNDRHESMFFNSIKILFQFLFVNKQLSIRDLQRIMSLERKSFNVDGMIIPFENCGAEYSSFISSYGFLISLRLFMKTFNSNKEVLLSKFRQAASNYSLSENGGYYEGEIETIIPQLLLLSEVDVHKFRSDKEFDYELINGTTIQYKLEAERVSSVVRKARYWIPGSGLKEYLGNEFTRLLLKAIENVYLYGLLNE